MKLSEIKVFEDQPEKHHYEVVYSTSRGEMTRVIPAESEEKVKRFVTAFLGQVKSIKKVAGPKMKAADALGYDFKRVSHKLDKPVKAADGLPMLKAMRDAEKASLSESVTFGVAKIKKHDGCDMFDTTEFAKEVMVDCQDCEGSGKWPSGETCTDCKGSGKVRSWEYDYDHLNVSNENAATIIDMLGTKDGDEYGGAWRNKDLPEIRRKLIKLKNGDSTKFTAAPTDEQGTARAIKDDDGNDRIGRGVRMIGGGRTQSQIDRYIDKLLAIIDFAQKNEGSVCWS